MKKIDILPLTVDLIGVFYRSARDALVRVKHATNTHPAEKITDLNIFPENNAETQATIETVVASFLTIEATINFTFFSEVNERVSSSGLDKWLKRKWKRGCLATVVP